MPDAIDVGKWVWEQRETVKVLLEEVFRWFRGKHDKGAEADRILVIGSGGCGKSTLGRLLSGGLDALLDLPGSYQESLGMETYPLQDDSAAELVVPPGQEHRRDVSWTALQADLANGLFRGMILLSSYGYHTLGDLSFRQHRLYRGGKREFLKEYLADRRNEEIRILKRLVPFVRTNPRRMWMLSLVTKQDLWWPRRTAVEQHYRAGAYGREIEELVEAFDNRRFHHELAFVSLVINNFKTGRDELMQKNVAGYDQFLQVQSIRRLFESVSVLMNWEAEQ